VICFSSSSVYSQQENDSTIWFRTVIKAVDAVGNVDTVVFYVKEGATKGIDTSFGEVNIYGQEPIGDLDIRIIQRKTESEWWLVGAEPSADENIDLKVDYRFFELHNPNFPEIGLNTSLSLVIKVQTKHYPVSVYLTDIKGFLYPDSTICYWWLYNENAGTIIAGSKRSEVYVVPPILFYVFNEPVDNNLIRIDHSFYLYKSIKDVIYRHPLYPNPSKGYIIIENGESEERFEITNLEGQIIQFFVVDTYPYNLDTTVLPTGTYYLRNSKGIIINNFIKE